VLSAVYRKKKLTLMVSVASTVQEKGTNKTLHFSASQEGRSRYLITADILKLEYVLAISSP